MTENLFSTASDDGETRRALASIGFVINAAVAPLFLTIGDELRRRYGSRIHLYIHNEPDAVKFQAENVDGRWDSVNLVSALDKALSATNLDPAAVETRARAFEARIDCSFNELGYSERMFATACSPGTYYPRNDKFLSGIDYTRYLHAYSEYLDYWEREIDTKGLTLLLQPSKAAAVMARSKGIRVRQFNPARVGTHWIWDTNEYSLNPGVIDLFDTLTEWPTTDLTGPYKEAVVKNARMRNRINLPAALKSTVKAAATHVRLQMRGHHKARVFPLTDFALTALREYWAFQEMTGPRVVRLEDLKGKPFAFYPMQKEPETGFQLMSPEFTSQHQAILAIARNLPVGALLVIKENITCLGRRPPGMYDQLARLKNVVFLHIEELGFDALTQAGVTVTIAGTAGLEAACLGKPVVSFGEHNTYNVMPHVHVAREDAPLRQFLVKAFDGTFDHAAARDQGNRFLEALKRCAFDMHNYGLNMNTSRRLAEFEPEALENALTGLVRSLPWSGRVTLRPKN